MKSILKTIIILILGTIIVDYIFVMSTGRKPFIVINTVKDGENVKYESILYDMYNCDGKVEVKFKNSYYVCPNITGEVTLFLNLEKTCNPLEPFYQGYYYTCPLEGDYNINYNNTAYSIKEAIDLNIIKFNNLKDMGLEYSDTKSITLVDKLDGDTCAQAIENYYEDDEYIYYFDCIKSNFVFVNINGSEYLLKEALNNKIVTVNELEDNNIILSKKKKTDIN